YGVPRHTAAGVDHFAYAIPATGAEVQLESLAWLEPLQRFEVRVAEIVDVDIVANAGAVRRWIVIAEDGDPLPLAQGYLQYDWNQVRLGRMVLADITLRAGPGGVEVPQGGKAEPIGMGIVVEHVFHHQLGKAIRID